jgi:hypothetical protein
LLASQVRQNISNSPRSVFSYDRNPLQKPTVVRKRPQQAHTMPLKVFLLSLPFLDHALCIHQLWVFYQRNFV